MKWPLSVAFVALACLGAAKPPSEGPKGLLNLQFNVTENSKDPTGELVSYVKELNALGCTVLASSTKWKDLEPSPGNYKLEKLKSDLVGAQSAGMSTYLTVQTIDTNNLAVPQDLEGKAWDSPAMLKRWKGFVTSLAKVLPTSTKWVMLGNEVDVYLWQHMGQLDAYHKFLMEGKSALQAVRPDVKVGVTQTFTGVSANLELGKAVTSGMDLVSFTYYPLKADFSVETSGDVEHHFDEMATFAGSRKVFLQEIGYPAAESLKSSEKAQAEAVDAVADNLKKRQGQFIGGCWFMEVDFSTALLNQLLGYYKVPGNPFKDYLSTLGLKKKDGTPRLAWAEFEKKASEINH